MSHNLLPRHIYDIFVVQMSHKVKSSSKEINDQLQAIQAVLERFRDGASIERIMATAGLNIELRTLQRRLAKLRQQGVVRISGEKRSTRYHLVSGSGSSKWPEKKEAEHGVPISGAGREIQSLVLLPETRRTPVGYNRNFLERYQPNHEGYLSGAEKQKLAKIGKTTQANQPAGTYAREILNRLLIDLSWNSSRLEGNTYSLLDTERLIALGETADNKTAMESQMILNHKDAIEFLVQEEYHIGFNRYTLLNLHALLSYNLLPDPAASGRLRQFGVGINKSVFTPPGVPQLIEEMFELVLEKASQINDPFEQAFFIMVQLPYLQPFDDVNKRVSRLAANIPFNAYNLAPLSFIDVPDDLYIQGMLGVYELGRIDLIKDVFLWAYERSSLRYAALRQSLGEPDPFRLKYRTAIRSLITEIVSHNLSRSETSTKIKEEAARLSRDDQSKFIQAVETEILSLHDGNFARYWIRPAEFQAWKQAWGK